MYTLRNYLILAGLSIGLSNCNNSTSKDLSASAKEEVAKAENDFQLMAAEKGIGNAFEFFADSNALIRRRNDTLIKGKEAIANFYKNPIYKTATLKWTPDLIEAAESGDLAYTYGHYTWLSKDSTGKINVSQGVFHTVWKKQKDGSWKYCWD
jgi:ketosteroid isomerase-like protein